MLKKIAQTSAIALTLTFLVVPVQGAFAQSSGSQVITGGNPMPTGEDSSVTTSMAMLMLLSALGNA